jgi:hypothetical protein
MFDFVLLGFYQVSEYIFFLHNFKTKAKNFLAQHPPLILATSRH